MTRDLARIASALERIAAALELGSHARKRSTGKTKRARPQYRPPAPTVPIDDISRERAKQALRRAGL